jgi:hypothetical protein
MRKACELSIAVEEETLMGRAGNDHCSVWHDASALVQCMQKSFFDKEANNE